eukprot:gene22981-31288_t
MGPPTDNELENFQNEVSEMDFKSQSDYAKSLIHSQIIQLFKKFENSNKNDCDADVSTNILIEQEDSDSVHIVKKLLITNFGFSVKTQKSLLPNAGNGVFVSINGQGENSSDVNHCNNLNNDENSNSSDNNKIDAIIVPGTVVAFFPGLVYTRADLRRTGAVDNLFPDNNLMLMSRYDGTVIDSRKANQTPSNPLSHAHRVNHCGNDNVPNVLPVAVDWEEDFFFQKGFPKELRRFIPNHYAKPPSFFRRLLSWNFSMKGVVLMSTRPLRHGDELLMDYRLNPTLEDLPPWYRSYDAEESRMRWGVGDEDKKQEKEKEPSKVAQQPRKAIMM